MDQPELAAYLVAARHDPARIAELIVEAEREPDWENTVRETIFALMSLLHMAGHNAVGVGMLLDLYAGFPEAIETGSELKISIVRADEPMNDPDVDELFRTATEGTSRADRVWNYRVLPGPLPIHAVVLEGSGFAPRYIAVMAGDARDAQSLRDRLASRDNR